MKNEYETNPLRIHVVNWLLRKLSAPVCLHLLSREEEACISMALITSSWKQKRLSVISAVFEAIADAPSKTVSMAPF